MNNRIHPLTNRLFFACHLKHIGNIYLLLLGIFCYAAVLAEQLTIDRIYADPALSGSAPIKLKISPDGKRITYLKAADDDYLRLDLWEYHIANERHQKLVDSLQFIDASIELSDVEKARRERQRISQTGIIDYFWSQQGDALLFPLNGDIYIYSLNNKNLKRLTDTESFETDIRFSPQGNYVSFIRDYNLVVIDIKTGKEFLVTRRGNKTISYGMAEFIAQEELNRDTGYWWSDDESAIALTRVDESMVSIEKRYEVFADAVNVFEQRYPKTGTPNAEVLIGVTPFYKKTDLDESDIQWFDLGNPQKYYITHVKWLPDNQRLAIVRQNRAQTAMDLLFADKKSGETQQIIHNTNTAWIDTHKNLYFLDNDNSFIWGADHNGFHHLALYDYNGEKLKQLTSGDWVVNAIVNVDQKNKTLFFTGNNKSPLEKHLYQVTYSEAPSIKQITRSEGWHTISFGKDSRYYIDSFSNVATPSQVSLHKNNGDKVLFLDENKLDQSHPYFPYLDNHIKPRFGTLQAEDGQTLYYQLTVPKNIAAGEKLPVIIDVYGGPHSQRVKNQWINPWHQFLADNGYIVFVLDNRGSANRGQRFEAPIKNHLGDIEVKDQMVGVNFLRGLEFVDPNKIGIFGWSYGGYMSIMSLAKAPTHFSAAVSVAPVTDWSLYDTAYTERYLQKPQDNPLGYAASSVFPYIKNLTNPLLLIHGMADDNVLFTNSTRLMAELQKEDIAFELMTYPGAKHSIRGKMIRRHLYKGVQAFFDKHLKTP